MRRVWIVIVTIFGVLCTPISNAQTTQFDDETPESPSEEHAPSDGDYLLFWDSSLDNSPLYDDILRYTTPPIATLRRGVSWWQLEQLYRQYTPENQAPKPILDFGRIKLNSSNRGGRIGVKGEYGTTLNKGWSIGLDAEGRLGRDFAIEGIFEEYASVSARAVKAFTLDHSLEFNLWLPFSVRALKGRATQECYDLTSNNLYNPSWGFYHGEVRSSNIRRSTTPTFYIKYNRPISPSQTLITELNSTLGKSCYSRLGWYDSSNPAPNYYNKMPSYFEGSTIYSQVSDSWRQNDTRYTQIAWDKFEQINLSSKNGESKYVVEDLASNITDIESKILIHKEINPNLEVAYGINIEYSKRRSYKQMRDLLGGDYLLDIDQFASDNSHMGNNLQNDLRHPDRHITEGDRFGYDFAHRKSIFELTLKSQYSTERLKASLMANFGSQRTSREGFYEKERFSGKGSFGKSKELKFAKYDIVVNIGYNIKNNHFITFQSAINNAPPLDYKLYISERNSNIVVDSPSSEMFKSLCVGYKHQGAILSLAAQGYIHTISSVTQIYEGFDDLSSTYCNYVVSGVSSRTLGMELSARARLSHSFTLSSTLSLCGAEYSSAPKVTMYDESDMSLISESRASMFDGCVVGNTPQLSASVGIVIYMRRGYIFNIDGAYYSMRYIAPSVLRRTDRVLQSATSPELLASMVHQERLRDCANLTFSVYRSFDLRGHTLSVYAKCDNLLDLSDIQSLGIEGNRAFKNLGGGSLQGAQYNYCIGRSYYISVAFDF